MAIECVFDTSIAKDFSDSFNAAKQGDQSAAVKLMSDLENWNQTGNGCKNQEGEALGRELADDGFEIVDGYGDTYDGEVRGETPKIRLTDESWSKIAGLITRGR
jgi:hypothetical protein